MTYSGTKEERAAKRAKYRSDHLDERRAYERKYYREHKSEARKSKRKYVLSVREKYLSQQAQYNRNRRQMLKDRIYSILGDECARCGFNDRRALQFDHVNGGGNLDRKRYKSNDQFMRHIIELNGEGFQVLCANCNWIKKSENDENYRGGRPRTLGQAERN